MGSLQVFFKKNKNFFSQEVEWVICWKVSGYSACVLKYPWAR